MEKAKVFRLSTFSQALFFLAILIGCGAGVVVGSEAQQKPQMATFPDAQPAAEPDDSPTELKENQALPLAREMKSDVYIMAVAVSKDGRLVSSVGGFSGTVPLWKIADAKLFKELKVDPRVLNGLAFSPDGQFLLACHEAPNGENICFWDLNAGQMTASKMGHPGITWSMIFLPDGKTLVTYGGGTISDNTLRFWDFATQEMKFELNIHGASPGGMTGFSASENGSLLAAPGAKGRVVVIDVAVQKVKQEIEIGKWPVAGADISRDGKRIVAAGALNEEAVIYDLEGDRVLHRLKLKKDARFARFSLDGSLVATEFGDRSVTIWSTESGENVYTFEPHEDPVDLLQFHPNGKVLLTAAGKEIRFWDIRSLLNKSRQELFRE